MEVRVTHTIQMVTGLDEKMSQWREGCLSNAEILSWLLNATAEVQMSMRAGEEVEAEMRLKRMGVPPYKAE